MKYPNKVYIRLMQQKHGLTVERCTQADGASLTIKAKDGTPIFTGCYNGKPE